MTHFKPTQVRQNTCDHLFCLKTFFTKFSFMPGSSWSHKNKILYTEILNKEMEKKLIKISHF